MLAALKGVETQLKVSEQNTLLAFYLYFTLLTNSPP